ncbi:MAG: O-antigen ligase family protein [Clostridiales bacterium]|uniref:O-antigen ligase family protein n=1 Tax=Clostridium sp. N3C TaxID=1776758 RepID=UPI00092DF912|nr:O-antigen ligase family protein [Clostridium sp. N3C]NLZ48458.1 O-antigen ligase family protein [Clostridiales bacterium]SCN21467.1 putative O-glycosylation ligase, exosortase A-associated [Clostridium sp. N3C]
MKKLFYYSFILYIVLFPLVPSRLNWKYPITEVMLLLVLLFYLLYVLRDRNKLKAFKENFIHFIKEPVSLLMLIITCLMMLSITYCTSVLLVLKETLRFGLITGLFFIFRFECNTEFYKEKLVKLIYYPAFIVLLIGFYEKVHGFGFEDVNGLLRIEATTGNPNIYGGYLVILFFPLLILMWDEKNKKKKIFYILELVMIFLSIIFTGSRNALLAMGLGGIIISVFYIRKLLYIFIPAFIVLLQTPFVKERLNTGDAGRSQIYKIAWLVFKDHPIIGVAIGNFEAVFKEYYQRYPQYQYNPDIYHTHNIYLKFLSELGIVGFIPFILLMIFILFNSIKAVKSSSGRIRNICIAITIVNVLFWIMSIFDNIILLPKVMNFYFIMNVIPLTILSKKKENKI